MGDNKAAKFNKNFIYKQQKPESGSHIRTCFPGSLQLQDVF